jgi:hypothetical protein
LIARSDLLKEPFRYLAIGDSAQHLPPSGNIPSLSQGYQFLRLPSHGLGFGLGGADPSMPKEFGDEVPEEGAPSVSGTVEPTAGHSMSHEAVSSI